MKFYSRQRELALLKEQYRQTESTSTMTVITGRRRIGKTALSKAYAEGKKQLYLFVSKKNEILLCEEFIQTMKRKFTLPVLGDIKDFKTVFKLIMELGKKERLVVIMDEFQEFYTINPSV